MSFADEQPQPGDIDRNDRWLERAKRRLAATAPNPPLAQAISNVEQLQAELRRAAEEVR